MSRISENKIVLDTDNHSSLIKKYETTLARLIEKYEFFTKEEYKNSAAPTLNHFYEKLLLLKDLMNTKTGKNIAHSRHEFMQAFLEQFYAEWDGNR